VAIVFAPGSIVSSQQRDLANQNTASNYLDTGPSSINNATSPTATTGTYIAADTSNSFNDRLMIIKVQDLMPLVEKRVAKELQSAFSNYIANNPNKYPNPAPISCSTAANCSSDISICRGWIPSIANNNPTWVLPDWFVPNEWYRVIYYSARSSRLADAPSGCNLLVSTSPTQALFFMTGPQINTQVRPSSNLQDYLEDSENNNLDDNYLLPVLTTTSNDTLYTLP
jgi:hypothetical protein